MRLAWPRASARPVWIVVLAAILVGGSSPASSQPVLVGGKWLDPGSGKIVGELGQGSPQTFYMARPTEGGRFLVNESLIADPATLRIVDTLRTPIRVVADTVMGLDARDGLRWRITLPWRVSNEPDEWGWKEHVVFLPSHDGVAAVDSRSGRVIWRADSLRGPVWSWGDLVLALRTRGPRTTNWTYAVALRASDGVEVWRDSLRTAPNFWGVWFQAGPIVGVTCERTFGDSPFLAMFDRNGREVWSVPETWLGTLPVADDFLLLSMRTISVPCDPPRSGSRCFDSRTTLTRITGRGRVTWRREFELRLPPRPGMMSLADGSVLLMTYSEFSDSGVHLIRVDSATGRTLWDASCANLDVGHLRYEHLAYVVERGDRLVVVSQGSFGWFVEVLARDDGRQLHRWQIEDA